MSSLADLPELVKFFSYSRSDDEHEPTHGHTFQARALGMQVSKNRQEAQSLPSAKSAAAATVQRKLNTQAKSISAAKGRA